jgi:ubiquinone biosynthesis UbiH/UbiF/VisC/COQ6 family hydroxylase
MELDVIIIAALAGASLAAALKPAPSLGLLESQPADTGGWLGQPIYAISPGNAAYLAECGAWQLLDTNRVQPVSEMRIFGDEGAELDFSAYQVGAPELNFILENRLLQHALEKVLQQQDNLTLFHPARCTSLVWHAEYAELTLADGRSLRAKLVVGADGRDSWVRQQAGIGAAPTLYQQHGVVANFSVEQPHRGTAFQWFQPDGILALLPLPQQMVSMVWSVSPEKSAALLALPPEELCVQVAAASQHTLGELKLVTPCRLPAAHFKSAAHHRAAPGAGGDAAHNVHPLAGAGVISASRCARAGPCVAGSRCAKRLRRCAPAAPL